MCGDRPPGSHRLALDAPGKALWRCAEKRKPLIGRPGTVSEITSPGTLSFMSFLPRTSLAQDQGCPANALSPCGVDSLILAVLVTKVDHHGHIKVSMVTVDRVASWSFDIGASERGRGSLENQVTGEIRAISSRGTIKVWKRAMGPPLEEAC